MLLIDGDILVYRVGWASEDEEVEVALRNLDSFTSGVLCFASDELEPFEIHLSGSSADNFRHDYAVTAEYKGNRKESNKPKHYQAIREALVSKWGAIVSEGQEADDAIAIAATEIQAVASPEPVRALMCSVDKDFYQIPGKHYNFVKHEFITVDADEAIINFYKQILTGDRVDNIIGLKGIGDVKSGKILKACEDEATLLGRERCFFTACVKAYMDNEGLDSYGAKQRVIENARLLWLRREEDQLWADPYEREESYFA